MTGVTSGYVEGVPIVEDLTLDVPRGGVTRLAGPNGTGKSTVVELISGYLRPWAGSVSVLGHDAGSSAARDVRRVVRTEPALYEYMTVLDHLAFFARVTGDSVERVAARAEALGLAFWFNENARALSSGTAKKLWYVACTAGAADLLVLDEPFNAVDEAAVELMVADLAAAAADRSVLLVCHTLPRSLTVDHTVALTTRFSRGPSPEAAP
jgi:ABC-type multidrug transport system ATPase subunit